VSAPASGIRRFGADTQVCPYAELPGCIYFSKTINAGEVSWFSLVAERRLTSEGDEESLHLIRILALLVLEISTQLSLHNWRIKTSPFPALKRRARLKSRFATWELNLRIPDKVRELYIYNSLNRKCAMRAVRLCHQPKSIYNARHTASFVEPQSQKIAASSRRTIQTGKPGQQTGWD
jgi:hypothetical protein